MKMPSSTRLKYRLMTLADGNRLLDVDSNPEVMKFISNGVPTSEHDLDNIILPRLAKYLRPDKGWGIWEVCDKISNEYFGWILVRPMHFFSPHTELDNWELGWRFKQSTWGKGYATESAKHIMQTLSKKHKIHLFTAIAVAENKASIQVMKKIGMSFEKSEFHVDPLINMQMEYYKIEI